MPQLSPSEFLSTVYYNILSLLTDRISGTSVIKNTHGSIYCDKVTKQLK